MILHLTLENLVKKLKSISLYNNQLVQKALEQARKTHATQLRDSGCSYLEQHIYPVTAGVIDYCIAENVKATPELVAGALLHDVLEDDNITDSRFISIFGKKVYDIVKPLTKPDINKFPGDTEKTKRELRDKVYFEGLKNSPKESKIIKLADKLNNLACAELTSEEKKKRCVHDVETFYLAFAKETSEYFYRLFDALLPKIQERNKR